MVINVVLNLDWVLEKVCHLMTIAAGLYPTTVPIGRESSHILRLFVWLCGCVNFNLAVRISIQWRTQGQSNSFRGTCILIDCEVVYGVSPSRVI